MKTGLILTILFAWIFTGTTHAQQQNRQQGFHNIQMLVVHHGDELQLTDRQKADLAGLQLSLRTANRQKIRGKRQNTEVQKQGNHSRRMGMGVTGRQRPSGSSQMKGTARTKIYDGLTEILTDQQLVKMQDIRRKNAGAANEFRKIQQELVVNQDGIAEEKREEVIGMLNEISDLRMAMQLYRTENPQEDSADKMSEFRDEIRTIQDDLKDLLTVSEFDALRPLNSVQNRDGRSMRPGR